LIAGKRNLDPRSRVIPRLAGGSGDKGQIVSDRRGCFKRGCLGCLALIGVLVLIAVVMLVLGIVTRGGESRPERIDREQVVPVFEIPVQQVIGEDRPPELPRIPDGFKVENPGRIELDLEYGQFEIVAGPVGSAVQVVGDYDAGRFKLEQSYTENDDGSWLYKIRFDRKGVGFTVISDDNLNRVTIMIPRQTPFELGGELGIGQTHLDLGGLWLLDLDLEVGVGEHRVEFSEPTFAPVPRVRLETSIGVIAVDHLGNASPSDATITHSVGETDIDLGGEWLNDAKIDIRCGVGECRVDTPDNTGLKYRDVGVMIGESGSVPRREAEAGQPTLTLSVSATIGEVRVR